MELDSSFSRKSPDPKGTSNLKKAALNFLGPSPKDYKIPPLMGKSPGALDGGYGMGG